MAAKKGQKSIVKRLLKGGAQIDETNGRHNPLIAASEGGHVDVVDYILSLEEGKEMIDFKEGGALEVACIFGHVDVVDRLLAAGCNVNPIGRGYRSALMWAAFSGHVSIIDRLVIHGADIHYQDEKGETALMIACSGRIEAAERLISMGCDINVQNEDGKTALMEACSWGKVSFVKFLIEHGADPSLSSRSGKKAEDMTDCAEIKILLHGSFFFSSLLFSSL